MRLAIAYAAFLLLIFGVVLIGIGQWPPERHNLPPPTVEGPRP